MEFDPMSFQKELEAGRRYRQRYDQAWHDKVMEGRRVWSEHPEWIIDRQEAALRYRRMGWSYADIGVVLGVSSARAHGIVKQAQRRFGVRT